MQNSWRLNDSHKKFHFEKKKDLLITLIVATLMIHTILFNSSFCFKYTEKWIKWNETVTVVNHLRTRLFSHLTFKSKLENIQHKYFYKTSEIAPPHRIVIGGKVILEILIATRFSLDSNMTVEQLGKVVKKFNTSFKIS